MKRHPCEAVSSSCGARNRSRRRGAAWHDGAVASARRSAAKACRRAVARSRRPMIELHTWNTPNGRKISVALEEMELPYRVHTVDISKDEQFDPAFLAISPNNKIPAIVDPEGPDGKPISVFESGAILIYLAEKTGRFLPRDKRERIAGARMAHVADGRLRADARPGAPLPPGQGPGGPALRAGALQQGNAPPLRRAGPSPGRTSLRGDRRRSHRSPTSPSSAGHGGTSGIRWTSPTSPKSAAGTRR